MAKYVMNHTRSFLSFFQRILARAKQPTSKIHGSLTQLQSPATTSTTTIIPTTTTSKKHTPKKEIVTMTTNPQEPKTKKKTPSCHDKNDVPQAEDDDEKKHTNDDDVQEDRTTTYNREKEEVAETNQSTFKHDDDDEKKEEEIGEKTKSLSHLKLSPPSRPPSEIAVIEGSSPATKAPEGLLPDADQLSSSSSSLAVFPSQDMDHKKNHKKKTNDDEAVNEVLLEKIKMANETKTIPNPKDPVKNKNHNEVNAILLEKMKANNTNVVSVEKTTTTTGKTNPIPSLLEKTIKANTGTVSENTTQANTILCEKTIMGKTKAAATSSSPSSSSQQPSTPLGLFRSMATERHEEEEVDFYTSTLEDSATLLSTVDDDTTTTVPGAQRIGGSGHQNDEEDTISVGYSFAVESTATDHPLNSSRTSFPQAQQQQQQQPEEATVNPMIEGFVVTDVTDEEVARAVQDHPQPQPPTAEAVKAVPIRYRNAKLIGIVLIVAIIVAIVVTAYVSLQQRKQQEEVGITPSPAMSSTNGMIPTTTTSTVATDIPTLSPTYVPTNAPTTIFSSYVERLSNVTNFLIMRNTSTSQYQAINWLANDDPLQLHLQQQDEDTTLYDWNYLKERYAIVTLYYASCGEKCTLQLESSFPWMTFTIESHCRWFGIQCQGTTVIAIGTTVTGSSSNSDVGLLGLEGVGNSIEDLGGSLPPELGLLSSLQSLNLGLDQDTGEGLNTLTGTLPTEIGLLSSLTYLNLAWNDLTGKLPTQMGRLTSLLYLDLTTNGFTGDLPSEIGLLTSLTHLSLAYNRKLLGTIPTEIGLLTSLSYLHLGSNDLTGNVPTEIGLLTSLTQLSIAFNYFIGTVPMEIRQLTLLEKLYISTNKLVGNMNSLFCETDDSSIIDRNTFPNLELIVADTATSEVTCNCC